MSCWAYSNKQYFTLCLSKFLLLLLLTQFFCFFFLNMYFGPNALHFSFFMSLLQCRKHIGTTYRRYGTTFQGKCFFWGLTTSRSFGKTQSAFGNVYSRICTWQQNKRDPVPQSHSELLPKKKYQYLKKLMTWYQIFFIHVNNFTLNNWKSFYGKKFVAHTFTHMKEKQLKYRF